MHKAIVITPVKDSPETTGKTIEAICQSDCEFDYFVYNDFSLEQTKIILEKEKDKHGFKLIHLEEKTSTPSPNYNLVLQMSQKEALSKKLPLIIIESDVIVEKDTIKQLLKINEKKQNAGLIGAITVDQKGRYNFPYNFEKNKSGELIKTPHSLSFCCTLISLPFLELFDFTELSRNKDWYDISISRQAKKMGFTNYLAKGVEVLHLPHSSRPWKNLKYSNPFLYYFKKILNQRDRI